MATFVAATVPVEQGKDNPLMDAAQAIGQPRDESEVEDKPAGAPEPRTGSYEDLMRMFIPR